MLFGAGLTLAGCYGLGCVVTRRVECSWPVRFCAGAGVLSLIVFLTMMMHAARPAVLAAVALVSACGILLRPPRLVLPRMPWWAAALFAIYGALYFANASGPEVEADPNVYHLTAARDALRYRGFAKEVSFYDRLPHAIELLYAIAFPFGGALAAKLVHFGFLVATVPLIVRLGGYSAALLYFLAPVVAVTGTSAFNDAALACATVATVVVLKDEGPPWLAGFIAGFCYAIKMTGGLAIVAGLAMLLWKRKWRGAAVFVAASAISVLPWVLRNLFETGNPFAPFLNAWFPNPYFHIASERQLIEALRSYGISFADRFPEVLWGGRVQGIIGPAFVLAPVALASPIALAMTIPWWLNAGARFLMPALPFIASEMAKRLPRVLIGAAVGLQALAAWPQVMEIWAPGSWRMRAYARPVTWDYHVAKMVERHTTPSDRIYDLHGVHAALIDRQLFGFWQSARNENALRALQYARVPGEEKMYELATSFPRRASTALRIDLRGTSIVEVELRDGDFRIPNRRRWLLDAEPDPWETPLAFDGNLASRWMAHEEPRPGRHLSVEFAGTEMLTNVRIIGTRWDGEPPRSIELRDAAGQWTSVDFLERRIQPPDLRPQATARLKKFGFTHIVARVGSDGSGQLGYNLANFAPEWRVDVVGNYDTVYLFRLR